MTTGHEVTWNLQTWWWVAVWFLSEYLPKNGLVHGHSESLAKGLLSTPRSSCCACPPSVSNCREPLENDWCCFLGPAHLHPICSCTLSPPRWPEDMFHNGWLVSVTLLAGVKVSYLCTQWSDRSLALGSENKSDFLPQIGLVYMVCIYVALIAHNKDRKVNSLKTSWNFSSFW